MVRERVGDRALVAVIGREVEDVVEVVLDRGEDLVVGDRCLDELDPRVGGEVLALGREQVVDDHDPLRARSESRPHEVRTDEAGAADDQEGPVVHVVGWLVASACFKWVNVSVTPYWR